MILILFSLIFDDILFLKLLFLSQCLLEKLDMQTETQNKIVENIFVQSEMTQFVNVKDHPPCLGGASSLETSAGRFATS